jgi:hypothetical protein
MGVLSLNVSIISIEIKYCVLEAVLLWKEVVFTEGLLNESGPYH